MENKKISNIAEKVISISIAFIASAFIVNGFMYFQPQFVYHIPRILIPVYNLLGHIGLAIGLILLGMAMIWYGINKWKKQGGKIWIYGVIIVCSIIIFSLLSTYSKKSTKSTEEHLKEMEDKRKSDIEKVMNVDRPKFNSKEANEYLDKLESLTSKHQKHIKEGNKTGLENDQKEYEELVMTSSKAINNLSNDEKYLFSQYNAKLMITWSNSK